MNTVAHRALVQADRPAQGDHVLVTVVLADDLTSFLQSGDTVAEEKWHQVIFEFDQYPAEVTANVHDLGELLGVALPCSRVAAQDAVDLADVLGGSKACLGALGQLAVTELEDLATSVQHRDQGGIATFLASVGSGLNHRDLHLLASRNRPVYMVTIS